MLRVGDFLYPHDPLIVKYSGLFREAFLTTGAIWRPTWATVAARWMDYWKKPIVPGAPVFPSSFFHIPWIVYLSPALAVRFPLPAEISSKYMPDGGLLLTATEEPFDPTSPEHLRRALIRRGDDDLGRTQSCRRQPGLSARKEIAVTRSSRFISEKLFQLALHQLAGRIARQCAGCEHDLHRHVLRTRPAARQRRRATRPR